MRVTQRGLRQGAVLATLAVTLVTSAVASASGFSIFEAGSRATAVGGAFVGRADDTSAMFYNPAGLAGIEKIEAMVDGVYPADAEHLGPLVEETRLLSRLIDDLRTLSLAESGVRRVGEARALPLEQVRRLHGAAGLRLKTLLDELGAPPSTSAIPAPPAAELDLVGALAVVNCYGDVRDPATGEILAMASAPVS